MLEDSFEEHARVLEEARRVLVPALHEAAAILGSALRAGGKVLLCGNGGSAADAQHFAAECVGRFEHERSPMTVLALTTDTSALTAIANDYGYEHVFARQIAALARPGDVLVAISTSGNSPNVVRAAEQARRLDCKIVALTGMGGGRLGALAHTLIAVPSPTVARVQEIHELCLHALAREMEHAVCAPTRETT